MSGEGEIHERYSYLAHILKTNHVVLVHILWFIIFVPLELVYQDAQHCLQKRLLLSRHMAIWRRLLCVLVLQIGGQSVD